MIVGRGGGVVMLYVVFFFSLFSFSFLGGLVSISVCLLDSLANEFLGGFFIDLVLQGRM